MRKTYLVTVDLDPIMGQAAVELAPIAIAEALGLNPFIHNPSVTLAPPSFQPLSNVEVRKNNNES